MDTEQHGKLFEVINYISVCKYISPILFKYTISITIWNCIIQRLKITVIHELSCCCMFTVNFQKQSCNYQTILTDFP